MLVLAAVSDLQYQRLRGAVAPRFLVVRAGTWDDALQTIRERPVEIALVDPTLGGAASGQEIERLHVLFPSLRLILYTSMTPPLAPVLLALGQCGIRQVVLRGVDDHPERLGDLVAAEAMHAASHRLLDQLTAALAPLPRGLRWVLEDALRSSGAVQTIQQVAARARARWCWPPSRAKARKPPCSMRGRRRPRRGRCCLSCRAIRSASTRWPRWFARAGLPSPRHILAAARVLYAHRLLQDPGFTIEDVAKRLGYAQTKTLQQHARTYLGLTAGEMRLSLTSDEATVRIVQSFLTPARPDAAANAS